MKFLVYYVIAVSLVLFCVMGWDKLHAVKSKRRIPENTLFLLAIIGGAPGGVFGMMAFRHKIRKPLFQWGFPLIALLWISGLVLLAVK